MIKCQFLRLGIVALLSALVFIGITHQVTAQNIPDPIQQTWTLHQHDRPLASPQLEIASTDTAKGEWVNYAKIGDVFRIIRPSITSGNSIFYRRVNVGSLDILF